VLKPYESLLARSGEGRAGALMACGCVAELMGAARGAFLLLVLNFTRKSTRSSDSCVSAQMRWTLSGRQGNFEEELRRVDKSSRFYCSVAEKIR
jgi:hypothetical protein